MEKQEMEDLDSALRDKIDAMFIEAKGKLATANASGAVQDAENAWTTLPEPKFGWDVSKSYTHALAKIYRDTGSFAMAISLMNELFASGTVKPHQDGPRFVMGTIYFEMDDLENSLKWFRDADQISKGRSFQGEDTKYHEFYKNIAAGK
jgi:hypothetical protein